MIARARSCAVDSFENQMEAQFKVDLDSKEGLSEIAEYLDDDLVQDMIKKPEKRQRVRDKLFEEYRNLLSDVKTVREVMSDDHVYLPVHLERLITNFSERQARSSEAFSFASKDAQRKTDLDPLYVVDKVEELLAEVVVVKGEDELSKEAQHNATILLRAHLRSTLSSKQMCAKYRLKKATFDMLIGEIKSKFQKSLAHSGECIGVLAAQSIGEPATQMTLNSECSPPPPTHIHPHTPTPTHIHRYI